MKNILLGWLAAQGIVLANDASDESIVKSVQQAASKNNEKISALGNERDTAAGKLIALENEKKNLTAALANEQAAHKSALRHAATFAVDLAIQRGKLTVADRESKITALENSSTFDADVKVLAEGKPVIKTEAVSGRQQAALGNEAQQTHAEYQEAFKTELIATGQDPVRAHNNIMRLPKYSGLAAKLVPQTKF